MSCDGDVVYFADKSRGEVRLQFTVPEDSPLPDIANSLAAGPDMRAVVLPEDEWMPVCDLLDSSGWGETASDIRAQLANGGES